MNEHYIKYKEKIKETAIKWNKANRDKINQKKREKYKIMRSVFLASQVSS